MMKMFTILILLIAVGYAYFLYSNNELPFIAANSSSVSIDDKIKCTTKEGRILYGKVPDGVICERLESVKGSIIILPSETKSERKDSINLFNKKSELANSKYRCDGRTYCSEMRSKAEAIFFIENCPNTKMDGDHDGQPCESDSRF